MYVVPTFLIDVWLFFIFVISCMKIKFCATGFPWILYLYFGTWRWNDSCSICQVSCLLLFSFACYIYDYLGIYMDLNAVSREMHMQDIYRSWMPVRCSRWNHTKCSRKPLKILLKANIPGTIVIWINLFLIFKQKFLLV